MQGRQGLAGTNAKASTLRINVILLVHVLSTSRRFEPLPSRDNDHTKGVSVNRVAEKG